MEAQFFNSSAKCERHLGLCHSQWTKHIMSQTTNHDVYDEMFMRFSWEFHGIFMVSSDVHRNFMGFSWEFHGMKPLDRHLHMARFHRAAGDAILHRQGLPGHEISQPVLQMDLFGVERDVIL